LRFCLRVVVLSLALDLLIGRAAAAHPHVFIKYAITLIFGDRDIAGLRLSWTFDEMYSSMIMSDYTKAKDGRVTPDEVKTIEQQNFVNLENFGFFLDLKINGAPVRARRVRDFDAHFDDHRAVFEFTVPLKTDEKQSPNVIEIGVFDPEYYVEFTLRDDYPVVIAHGEGFSPDCNVARDGRKMSALGPVGTDLTTCTYMTAPQ